MLRTLSLLTGLLGLLLFLGISSSAMGAEGDLRFVVRVTSSLAPNPVTVTTSIHEGAIRSESLMGEASTVTIIAGGKTYLLEPDLEIAQVTPLRSASDAPAAQRKYWGLVDPLQVAPTHLPALFEELGARSLGSDKLEGIAVEAWVLSIPAEVDFPLDNLHLYVKTDGMPYRMDYRRNKDETVTVEFLEINTTIALDPALFLVPESYRLVEYEW